jgi:hypothetical protein
VRVTRVGGGLGEPCTAHTNRVSCRAGISGKSDATWASGPIPNSMMSIDGCWPPHARSASAYRAAESAASSPHSSGVGTACTRFGSTGTWSRSAVRAPVSFRSGDPAGTKRSSPHQISIRDQSMESRAGLWARAAKTAVPIPPPVRHRLGIAPDICRSRIVATILPAVASASDAASAWRRMSTGPGTVRCSHWR